MKSKSIIPTLAIYFVLFYIAWGASEFLLNVQNELLYSIIREGIIKNLVWTLPAFVLIKKRQDSVEIPLKEMFNPKTDWLKYLPIYLVFAIYILFINFRTHGGIVVSDSFGLDSIVVVLFVGLTEELVFRGWLLNATIKGKSEEESYLPILINGIMFLTIHFPKWIHQGTFVSSFTSLGFIQIVLLGCLFGYVFVKSRNLLIPITLHMFWDLLVFIFQ
jgi:hypothetical protein